MEEEGIAELFLDDNTIADVASKHTTFKLFVINHSTYQSLIHMISYVVQWNLEMWTPLHEDNLDNQDTNCDPRRVCILRFHCNCL